MEWIGLFLRIIIVIIYMLPAIIAYNRKHAQAGLITFLTVITGWIWITWIIWLIWGLTWKTVEDVKLNKELIVMLKDKLQEKV